ncbi:uncharacterized protein [Littorina saxatilis]|uniref:Transcription factor IIIC 90kDa subunit N-terminal domain-containing protein n=1 Tax=Littorina saxatilis TaxID=31220 RepID=A0AAN9BR41_9CAEN
MAATQVCSVEASVRQSLSWSHDDRIAISADKEIMILSLDASPSIKCEFRVSAKVKLSTAELTDKRETPWTTLEDDVLPFAKREKRSAFLKKWTYSALAFEEQVTQTWNRLSWSPAGVNDRSVLAALTTDHHISIFGQSSSNSKWTQLADLGDHLLKHHFQDFQSEEKQQKTKEEYLAVVCNQMLSIAAVELAWSSVFEGLQSEGGTANFVLLFVGMRNGDVVSWKISLPMEGVESCTVVGRQSSHKESSVLSLAWTTLPENKNSGLLAVGYADGQVECQWYHHDPAAPADQSLHRCTQVIQGQVDWMPVSALTWTTHPQLGLTLLCTKEQITWTYTISPHSCSPALDTDCTMMKEEPSGEDRISDGGRIEVTGSSQTRLGNWLPASGLQTVGDTVVMASEDGSVALLLVTGSRQDPVVKIKRKLEFQLEETGMGCISVSLSPNTAMCTALFRPNFAVNHLSVRFRIPIHAHICLVHTPDWTTLEQMLAPDKVGELTASRIDILEFARRILCNEAISEETIESLTQRLLASPYADTVFGRMVTRHLLSTLCSMCIKHKLTAQVPAVEVSQHKMTDILLCQQIRSIWNIIHSQVLSVDDKDLSVLNTMLNWVRGSNERAELVGSEVMNRLTSAISEPKPDTCVLCDGEMSFSGSAVVTCPNSHSFGLCCHTLSVCNTVRYQCCTTCGVLALLPKQLKGHKWLPGNPIMCTLCNSFMYNTTTGLRL